MVQALGYRVVAPIAMPGLLSAAMLTGKPREKSGTATDWEPVKKCCPKSTLASRWYSKLSRPRFAQSRKMPKPDN
jgi:hypothetical protein